MARIILTIDYPVDLANYPDHVTTKGDAMRFDVQSVFNGCMSAEDLMSNTDDIIYEVVDWGED